MLYEHIMCISTKDDFMTAPGRSEPSLHCIAVSHWPGAVMN